MGIQTIGVGFDLERSDAKAKIEALGLDFAKVKGGTEVLTDSQILKLLDTDIENATSACKTLFPKFSELSEVRQRVLIDMMFNLGRPRFEKFKKMISAVESGNFAQAADEMKASQFG